MDSYDGDFQQFNYGDGSQVATWTTDIPTAGTYKVYARWISDTNRPTNAPYTIYHQGGSTEVAVDQTINSGLWVELGTFTFDVDTYSVELRSVASKITIADAVWWELQ